MFFSTICHFRLKSTWEKLPGKYQRLFSEMQQLMDPSRNMSKYRNLVCGEDVQPPIIPFYPVVKKDLTFIHLANDSRVDGLVNFEKLRMIAKEVLAGRRMLLYIHIVVWGRRGFTLLEKRNRTEGWRDVVPSRKQTFS